jgi:hypothetical protein
MTLDERIAKYTLPEPNSGCWLWAGACGSSGYPQLTVRDEATGKPKSIRVHRYVCERAGAPAGDLYALHKCDVKVCVNPDHLYFGTQNQNILDVIARGRSPDRRGEKSKLNKLTWADIHEIRASADSNSVLAARYGVARSRISDIRTMKSWR